MTEDSWRWYGATLGFGLMMLGALMVWVSWILNNMKTAIKGLQEPYRANDTEPDPTPPTEPTVVAPVGSERQIWVGGKDVTSFLSATQSMRFQPMPSQTEQPPFDKIPPEPFPIHIMGNERKASTTREGHQSDMRQHNPILRARMLRLAENHQAFLHQPTTDTGTEELEDDEAC